MKTRKVNRYYCEFCKKANCSAPSIKKHEERCTMNPNRKCGYCHLLKQEQPNLAEIIALLPDIEKYKRDEGSLVIVDNGCVEEIARILPIIREKTGNCPACIMAVFRQAKTPLPLVEGFDFKKEGEAIWAEFNADQRRADEYSSIYG